MLKKCSIGIELILTSNTGGLTNDLCPELANAGYRSPGNVQLILELLDYVTHWGQKLWKNVYDNSLTTYRSMCYRLCITEKDGRLCFHPEKSASGYKLL